MSICTDCLNPKPIARCITNLIIGKISSINTLVYVYVANKTLDNRIIRYAVTSSADGTVTIPITPQRFSEDHSYEIHITKQDAKGVEVRENITIDSEVADCVALDFEMIFTNDNLAASYTNQTLSI